MATTTPRTLLAALLLAPGAAACDRPAAAPVIDVAPTGDTLTMHSGPITEAAWLGGQRWAVLGPDDEKVWLVDFADRSTIVLGRPGTSYRNPFGLFSQADTLYLNDWGLGRTTVWSATGALLDSVAATSLTRGALPHARDRRGQFYAAVRPRPGPDGSGNRDSAAVLRTDGRLAVGDTVARLSPFDIEEVFGDAGRRFERKVFSGEDAWGVLPDGVLWIARVNHNRVWLFGPGGSSLRGPMLPDPVYPVTRADRQAFLNRFPPALRQTAERLPFAEIKPPFVAGFTEGGEGGTIWLQKSRRLSDSVQVYHRVGPDGKLEALVRLPLTGRILAASPSHLLVAKPVTRDEGAGVKLWQFANPPLPGPQASPEMSSATLPK